MCVPCSHEGQVRHYHIKQDPSKMYFISEKHCFATIKELIEYHKLNGGGVLIELIIDQQTTHWSPLRSGDTTEKASSTTCPQPPHPITTVW